MAQPPDTPEVYARENTGQKLTTNVVGNLKVGQPAPLHVFHVNPAIKIQQWAVVRPCDLVNGLKDSLPDLDRKVH